MRRIFSAPQQAALKHPFFAIDAPDPHCRWMLQTGPTLLLTCDVDPETLALYGQPVWHASVSPPEPEQAERALDGVGTGPLIRDQNGVRPGVYHLRRRMTAREIEQLG